MFVSNEEFSRVKPDVIIAYLESHGWTGKEHCSDYVVTYAKEKNYSAHLVHVPLRRDFADYANKVDRCVSEIAAFEKKYDWEVLMKLNGGHCPYCKAEKKGRLHYLGKLIFG